MRDLRPTGRSLDLAPALMLAFAHASCGERPDAASSDARTFAIRDSAGIEIVHSTAPAWTEGEEWMLSSQPVVSIGSGADGPDALFEIGSIVPLSDGRFVVAHSSRSELIWFDSAGTRRHVAGREGEGPGEFRSIGRLFPLPGDSLLVVDGRLMRISVFDDEGRFVTSSQLDVESAGLGSPRVLLPDRTLLALPGFSFGPGTPDGLHRDTATFPRFALDGSFVGVVGPFPIGESWVFTIGGSKSAGNHPFERRTFVAPARDGFWIATGDRPEAELRDANGALHRIVRWAETADPLTAGAVREYEAEVRRSVTEPDERQFVNVYLEGMRYPETLPTLGGLMADSERNLWVEPFASAVEEPPTRWMVFEAEGRLLGEVSLPERFEPRAVTADRVYGVWIDDLEVEWLHVYRLGPLWDEVEG